MGKEAGKGAGRELRSGGARCRDDLAVNNIQLIFEHKNYKCDPEKMEDMGNQSLKKDLTEGQVWPGTPCGNRKQVLRRDRVRKRGSRKSLRQCPHNLSNGQGRVVWRRDVDYLSWYRESRKFRIRVRRRL